ncbi:hypothetical protein OV079_23850 [Nannocystis pusilla]|uniref:Uncharacterized protein n=1 Tax=Nannocystis pusilla TaxID=889268 RepID=A0A9X3EQR4_9BACT|nr:hypothetical protein [Nannocystis pusilla]MCY1004013.1 hypothetical protein [Nannocystis pusilla]MCY1008537.1 hypothetical protein [Nannocystis pusilla]
MILRRALAERLLATPVEGLDEESARRERRERFQRVLGTLRAFAELCRKDDSKSRWWGPNMLSQQVAQGKTLSPWAMVERNVADAERAAGAAEVKAREAAARAAAVMVPTTPTSPQDAAEREAKARAAQEMAAILGGSVRFGGPTSARARGPVAETELDQERERRRGQRREARDERDEDREIQRRWQLNAALARAREAKGEPLTDDEANKIRAGFGESEEHDHDGGEDHRVGAWRRSL